ncbi:hypothetical protein NHX12_010812, partial [Muraenolepis orangiensis]
FWPLVSAAASGSFRELSLESSITRKLTSLHDVGFVLLCKPQESARRFGRAQRERVIGVKRPVIPSSLRVPEPGVTTPRDQVHIRALMSICRAAAGAKPPVVSPGRLNDVMYSAVGSEVSGNQREYTAFLRDSRRKTISTPGFLTGAEPSFTNKDPLAPPGQEGPEEETCAWPPFVIESSPGFWGRICLRVKPHGGGVFVMWRAADVPCFAFVGVEKRQQAVPQKRFQHSGSGSPRAGPPNKVFRQTSRPAAERCASRLPPEGINEDQTPQTSAVNFISEPEGSSRPITTTGRSLIRSVPKFSSSDLRFESHLKTLITLMKRCIM